MGEVRGECKKVLYFSSMYFVLKDFYKIDSHLCALLLTLYFVLELGVPEGGQN